MVDLRNQGGVPVTWKRSWEKKFKIKKMVPSEQPKKVNK